MLCSPANVGTVLGRVGTLSTCLPNLLTLLFASATLRTLVATRNVLMLSLLKGAQSFDKATAREQSINRVNYLSSTRPLLNSWVNNGLRAVTLSSALPILNMTTEVDPPEDTKDFPTSSE